MKTTKLSIAISTLKKELAKDKTEGSYYHGWQSNIAMAFYDEFKRSERSMDVHCVGLDLHKIANRAAKNFLDTLIKQ